MKFWKKECDKVKFTASYSGGKDSALAIYRAVSQGHTPILLITTYNVERSHSYSHAIPESVLECVSDSLGIPKLLVKTTDAEYLRDFEKALAYAKELGAEACVFGDIDIEGHRLWCSERCENAGLKPLHPLWGEDRRDIVFEFIDKGFVANITVVNTKYLDEEFLGKQLTREVLERICSKGIDICGESGEYHTFVSDGPIFRRPVDFSFGEKIINGEYTRLEVNNTNAHSK